jgi:hypothetical protein
MRTIEKIIVGGSTVFVAAFLIAAFSTTTPRPTSPATLAYQKWQTTTAADIGRAARAVEYREQAEQRAADEAHRVFILQHRLWVADQYSDPRLRGFCRQIAIEADGDCPLPGEQ